MITKEKIKNLCKLYSDEGYQEIRQLLLEHIKINPADIEVRLKFIKHIYSTELDDPLNVVDYINDILNYDPNNIQALLFLAYIQRFDLTEMDEKLIHQLKNYKCDDNEIMAMIAIAISWYYELAKQVNEQEKWLKQSLKYCSKIVRNYYELIVLYIEQNKVDQARELIPFALNNITHIFKKNYWDDEYLSDSTNIDEFFNIRYKMIHEGEDFVDRLLSWKNDESMSL